MKEKERVSERVRAIASITLKHDVTHSNNDA